MRSRVGDMHISFKIEPSRASTRRSAARVGYSLRASEPLKLEISPRQYVADLQPSWEDSQEMTLESQITEIAVGLLVAGEWTYRKNQIYRHEQDVERRKCAEEKIRRTQAAAEHAERQRLFKFE